MSRFRFCFSGPIVETVHYLEGISQHWWMLNHRFNEWPQITLSVVAIKMRTMDTGSPMTGEEEADF